MILFIKIHCKYSSTVSNWRLYSILGEELRVLINEKMTAGVHKYTLDASALPSGVYIYRLRTGGGSDTKKLVVLK